MKIQKNYNGITYSDETALGIAVILRYIFEELPKLRKQLDANIVNLEICSTFESFSKLCKDAESSNPILNQSVDDFYKSIKTKKNYIDHYVSIIKETLSQDRVNWGRIVTFVSFTKILLDKSIQDGRLDIAKQIIKELPILIEKHTENWINTQNGWKHFETITNNRNHFTSTLKLTWNFISNSLW